MCVCVCVCVYIVMQLSTAFHRHAVSCPGYITELWQTCTSQTIFFSRGQV